MGQGIDRRLGRVVHVSEGLAGILADVYQKIKRYQADQAKEPEPVTEKEERV